jgi:hypothetical protein
LSLRDRDEAPVWRFCHGRSQAQRLSGANWALSFLISLSLLLMPDCWANFLSILGWYLSILVAAAAQVTATNVDIASVALTYHLYTKEEIEEVVSRL